MTSGHSCLFIFDVLRLHLCTTVPGWNFKKKNPKLWVNLKFYVSLWECDLRYPKYMFLCFFLDRGTDPWPQTQLPEVLLAWNYISSPVFVCLVYFRCQISPLSCFFMHVFSLHILSSVIDPSFFSNKVYMCLWMAVYVQVHVCTHVGWWGVGIYVWPCGSQRTISIVVSVCPVFWDSLSLAWNTLSYSSGPESPEIHRFLIPHFRLLGNT